MEGPDPSEEHERKSECEQPAHDDHGDEAHGAKGLAFDVGEGSPVVQAERIIAPPAMPRLTYRQVLALEKWMTQQLPQSDIDAIARTRDSFVTAVGGDDVDAMLALLTHDGAAFPPHEEALVGRDANRAWHEARIAEFETEITISTDELVGEGSLAFERFSYTLTLKPRAGGEPIVDTGNCFWFWRREDGSWRVARAMWNSPAPLPQG